MNEAAQLGATLTHVRATAPSAEVIVVDGGSTDGTLAIAAPYAQVITASRGRALQMNAGAAVACGDVLLFLHADVWLPDGASEAIARALADPHVVGGAFGLRFDEAGWLYRCIAFSTNLRAQVRQSFTGDQAIFVRTPVFQAIGGYADIPLMEDLEFCQRLRTAGHVSLLRRLVLISARRHRAHGPLRVVVWGWVLQTLYALGTPEHVLHQLYYGRPVPP